MRILVLRGGALGDFIVTLPALRALRAKWPQAQIELAGNSLAAGLGQDAGWLDAVYSQHQARWAALYDPAPLPEGFAEWLNTFDVIITFWPDPDGVLQNHLQRLRATIVCSHATVESSPAAKHFCDALLPLGIVAENYEATLQAGPETTVTTAGLPTEPFIAVHPGSGSKTKNWPLERWMQLIETWRRPTIIITGEAETDLQGPPNALPYTRRVHNLPLRELRTLLRSAKVYLGHDTGVSHLAAAVGTPSLLLFGPTAPHIWAPPGLQVRIVKAGGALTDITVEQVLAAAQRLWES